MPRTRKRSRSGVPWAGWVAPTKSERLQLRAKCGAKCFMGPGVSFPVCRPNTKCQIDQKGVWAAYIRAKEFSSPKKTSRTAKRRHYQRIANRSHKLLEKV